MPEVMEMDSQGNEEERINRIIEMKTYMREVIVRVPDYQDGIRYYLTRQYVRTNHIDKYNRRKKIKFNECQDMMLEEDDVILVVNVKCLS